MATQRRAETAGRRGGRGAAPTLRERAFLAPRLNELLRRRFETGMLLVQAPAGCGKTATVLQFLQDEGIEPWWYLCTADDGEPGTLLRGIVTAMGGGASVAGQTTLAALAATDARQSYRTALKVFLDEVTGADARGGVLVVDDADVILESPSVEALDYLISSLAATTRVVLLSRAEVPLGSQAKRLLEGHAARVMAEDLLFRREEIGAFAGTVFRVELAEDETDRLYRATGGWAIALSLALRLRDLGTSMQTDEHAQFTPEARADLFSYLAAEVLSRVDEGISGFLRQTAILDELDPSICGRITGEERPVEVIQSLARAGLPVVKSGWGTYRCHSLLREYFLHTLDDHELRQSHSEAGRAFAGVGNWAQALHHFVAAGDKDAALTLIDEHGRELFHAGHGRALLDLVKTASSDQLAGHYRAEYWAAFAASRMFELDWAAAALDRVSEEATGRGDDAIARDALRALAYLLNGWGRFEPAMVVAKQLRDSVPEHETASRAAITLGYLTTGMGATEQFRESLELTRTQLPLLAMEPRADAIAEAYARAVSAVTLAFEGDFAAGRAELNQADMLMSGHEDDVVATFIPWSRALVEFQAGNPDAADDATHIAEAMALRFGDLQRVLECRAIRASTAVLRGNVDEADRGFAQLDDLRAGGTDFWGILFALLSRPHRLRLHGDLPGARNAAEANNALATATASAWFMCSTRLDVANFRLLTGDGEGACEPAQAALAEAVAMSADVLLYGAHLMIAATGADDEAAAMAEALRIADARDYRFLMPYGVRLPELDSALWRGLETKHAGRAAILLMAVGPVAAKVFPGAAAGMSEGALLLAIDVLCGHGGEGRKALQGLADGLSETVAVRARAALAGLEAANPHRLSPREREVLELLAQGLRTKDVAGRLYLTPATVSTHIQRIMSKTNTTSRAELLALAAREAPPAAN